MALWIKDSNEEIGRRPGAGLYEGSKEPIMISEGIFIDTTKILHTFNSYNQSWTATEDCWVGGTISQGAGTSGARVMLDGVMVGAGYIQSTNSNLEITISFYAKKGQVISTRDVSTTVYNVNCYALKKTGISVQAEENYSTDEQIIGTWIDGKPLYRKVMIFTNLTTGEKRVPVDLSYVATMVKMDGILAGDLFNGCNMNSFQNWGFCLSDWTIDGINMYIGPSLAPYLSRGATIIMEYTKVGD